MTYDELKKEIVDLGFEDDTITTEYGRVFIHAINRAIAFINSSVRPIVKSVELVTPGILDMATVADFVDFDERPYYGEGTERKVLSDFFIENRTKVVVNGDFGPVTVYYKAAPTPITADTPGTFEIELDRVVQPLIPLLAAYYVWLDDDERKAAYYFNQFDQMKNQILGGKPLTVSFNGGLAWHR